jgi:hypothetical protein
MSIAIMSKVFYTDFPKLPSHSVKIKDSDKKRTIYLSPPIAKIVMLAISDSADDFGQNSWNSIDRLAMKTNLNRRTIRRTIEVLIQNEYLILNGISEYGTNNIGINLEKLSDPPKKRSKTGRPQSDEEIKSRGSESETGGSESKSRGSVPPDSSLSIQNHPLQNSLQEVPLSPAKKRSKEEMLKSTEVALMKGLANEKSAYAHFNDRLIPVVEKMDKLWHFGVPGKKSKQYGLWITTCEDILQSCGEYGIPLLDELYDAWVYGLNTHNGLAPYPINGPQSISSAVRGIASAKRRGEKYVFSYPSYIQEKHIHHSMLDV